MYEVPKFNSPQDLLEWLIGRSLANEPTVVSYEWYQKNVLRQRVGGRVNDYAVTHHATNGPTKHTEGLGTVQLDTFIVNTGSHEPGDGHWKRHDLTYDKELWKKYLKGARLLHTRELPETTEQRDRKLNNLGEYPLTVGILCDILPPKVGETWQELNKKSPQWKNTLSVIFDETFLMIPLVSNGSRTTVIPKGFTVGFVVELLSII